MGFQARDSEDVTHVQYTDEVDQSLENDTGQAQGHNPAIMCQDVQITWSGSKRGPRIAAIGPKMLAEVKCLRSWYAAPRLDDIQGYSNMSVRRNRTLVASRPCACILRGIADWQVPIKIESGSSGGVSRGRSHREAGGHPSRTIALGNCSQLVITAPLSRLLCCYMRYVSTCHNKSMLQDSHMTIPSTILTGGIHHRLTQPWMIPGRLFS